MAPGGPSMPGALGTGHAGNAPLWDSPEGSGYGGPGRPTQMPGGPGEQGWPGRSDPYPTGGYPTDPGYGTYQSGQFSGLPYSEQQPQQTDRFGRPLGQGGPPPGLGGQGGPGGPGGQGMQGGQGGYSDMLGGGFPPSDYGYPQADDRHPEGGPGAGPQYGGPAPRPGQGIYDEEPRSGYGQDYYEGGYEDGRFR